MKKIEKLALGLIVLWGVGVLCFPVLLSYSSKWIFSGNGKENLSFWEHAVAYSTLIGKSLFTIGCAVWLFIEAKKNKENKWVWALFGLVFRTQGIIIFYGYTILKKMTEQKHRCEQINGEGPDMAGAKPGPSL